MEIMNYVIVGGRIRMAKSAFIQETLRKDSLIRTILSWKTTGDFTKKHPWVSGPDENNFITINFTSEAGVELDRNPGELLSELKARYGGRLRGKVSFRGTYGIYGGVFFFEIDLDSSAS